MWIGVTERFRRFHSALMLTEDEVQDGIAKQLGIRQSLERAYWGSTTDSPPGFIVGSWGKGTAIRPPNDVDIFVQLPLDIYARIDGYTGNKQSALIQEVKNKLLVTYPQTLMRGDGQVVVVKFNTLTIEVVPVFRWDGQGAWLMPDMNDGGKWKLAYPDAEVAKLDNADSESRGNCRLLTRIIKAWKFHCDVPIKSFIIEQLVAEFVRGYLYRDEDFYYFDWFVRDFLEFLIAKRNTAIYAPASNEFVAIGDGWLSRAKTAYGYAVQACDYERGDFVVLAGYEWQKIFGTRIPAVIA